MSIHTYQWKEFKKGDELDFEGCTLFAAPIYDNYGEFIYYEITYGYIAHENGQLCNQNNDGEQGYGIEAISHYAEIILPKPPKP